MTAVIPGYAIESPPVPGTTRYGLFNAATIYPQPAPMASIGGVEFEPRACGGAHLYSPECPIDAQDAKTIDQSDAAIRTQPFWAYASIVCSPVGRTIDEQALRARQRLIAGEQTQVETAFWNGGGVGAAPALTTMGATAVVTALTSFGARLSALIEAFQDAYGYPGTIHVNTRAMGAAAFGQVLVRATPPPDVPAHLVTPTGEIWSFGAGYDITGPGDVAPAAGSAWAFITPPVNIWRDADISMQDPRQTFNRTTNQATVVAERGYNIAPDCLTAFAIELPLEAA